MLWCGFGVLVRGNVDVVFVFFGGVLGWKLRVVVMVVVLMLNVRSFVIVRCDEEWR